MMKHALPDRLPDQPDALEAVIDRREQAAGPLKPGTEAKIVWHEPSQKRKTPYAIVYLHGFKGSHGEGAPVHRNIADAFGCNLYLSRLEGHGLVKRKPLADLTPSALVESALEACRIGQKIGKRVILMGTSTGGSLALHAAGATALSSSIDALILYSPLVHLYGLNALLLEHALGRTVLKSCPGKNYMIQSPDPGSHEQNDIWYATYALGGALALGKMTQRLIKPALFKNITCPAFVGYYYQDLQHHDRVVSTSAIKRMARQLGSTPSDVTLENFPGAGTHVICNGLLSDAVDDVCKSTRAFLSRHLPICSQSAD